MEIGDGRERRRRRRGEGGIADWGMSEEGLDFFLNFY